MGTKREYVPHNLPMTSANPRHEMGMNTPKYTHALDGQDGSETGVFTPKLTHRAVEQENEMKSTCSKGIMKG